MKTLRFALLCVGLMHAAFAHATHWFATQLYYQPQGWSTGEVTGLNNLGQVVGVLQPPPFIPGGGFVEAIPMAFVTGPNGSNLQPIVAGYQPYGDHCATGCHPYPTPSAINDAGQISAVTQAVSASTEAKVSLFGPSGHDIPPPVPMEALFARVSLNSSGQLAGTYDGFIPAGFVSFVTDANGSNPHLLGMLDNSNNSNVWAINDSGQLLVSGVLAGTTENKTFVTGVNASGVAFEVGSFGHDTFANGLNNSAQLIGSYRATVGGEERAFITGANGVGFTDIGSLGGGTFASALNNNGLVVGSSADQAFLYGLKGGGITNLNSLIALKGGEFLNAAIDVNERGQIVAQSNLGKMYLLTPVPEPATYLMFLGGLALIHWKTRGQTWRFT